jgi:hypothetical protein
MRVWSHNVATERRCTSFTPQPLSISERISCSCCIGNWMGYRTTLKNILLSSAEDWTPNTATLSKDYPLLDVELIFVQLHLEDSNAVCSFFLSSFLSFFLPVFLSFLKFRNLYYVVGNTLAVFHRIIMFPVNKVEVTTHPSFAIQHLPLHFSLYYKFRPYFWPSSGTTFKTSWERPLYKIFEMYYLKKCTVGLRTQLLLKVSTDAATGRAAERRIVPSTCLQIVYNNCEQMAQAVTRQVLFARYAMYCHLWSTVRKHSGYWGCPSGNPIGKEGNYYSTPQLRLPFFLSLRKQLVRNEVIIAQLWCWRLIYPPLVEKELYVNALNIHVGYKARCSAVGGNQHRRNVLPWTTESGRKSKVVDGCTLSSR